MKRNAADEIMEGYDTSEKNLKRQRLERQPFSVSQVIWVRALCVLQLIFIFSSPSTQYGWC
uniref:Uncharacterized protein n=1 Tax=Trichobilharzia regenti TaxID=157069 RepID=A0AA85IZ47_TRIRE|nr:unnamed protein product [Trichobilharzia regenti]